MSGTDIPDFLAPTRLTPVAADQAIGTAADGSQVLPSMYFSRMIQRILSYLGQPSASATGQNLTEQVVSVTQIANTAILMAQAAQSGTAAVSSALQQVASSLALVLPLAAPVQPAGSGPSPSPATGGVANVSGAVAAPSVTFPSAPAPVPVRESAAFPSAPSYAPSNALPLLPPPAGLSFPQVMAIRYFGF